MPEEEWLTLLRETEGWSERGAPHEKALIAWVKRKEWSEERLEASAIGLGKVKTKVLRGYSSLSRAFQDRLNNGYDIPSSNGTKAKLKGPEYIKALNRERRRQGIA